jgi:hypothetical protein
MESYCNCHESAPTGTRRRSGAAAERRGGRAARRWRDATAERRDGGETRRRRDATADAAVKTLLRLTRESAPPTVQLGATRATLELGMKLREMYDLQNRVALLEAQLRPGPRLAKGTES